MKNNNNYIKLEDCKDSYLYIIDARNADIGIFEKEKNHFIISRFKFKSNFIFHEDHWDTGAPFGTVKPIKELYYIDYQNLKDNELLFLETLNNLNKDLIDIINSEKKLYYNNGFLDPSMRWDINRVKT